MPMNYRGIYARQGRGGPPGSHRTQREHVGYELGQGRGRIRGRQKRTDDLLGQYDEALSDPEGQANRFRDVFEDYAEGFAAPQQRDFQDSIQGVAGSVAARFGGNASGEEQRQVMQAGDLFSRNLTEALSRLAPEALAAGFNYTNMLGDAAGNAQNAEDRLRALIAQLALGRKDKEGGDIFGKAIGTAAGVATAFL
jgi:hypothetical protein